MSSKQICRLCLGSSQALSSLFVDNRAQMLETLTSVKVSENDPSTKICLGCLCNLRLAFTIQQNIRQADEKLRTTWASSQEIKTKNQLCDELKDVTSNDTFINYLNISDGVDCLICGQQLADTDRNEHLERHFQNGKVCNICNQPFVHFLDYKEHFMISHKHTPAIYRCQCCNSTFFYEQLYRVHMENLHRPADEIPIKEEKSTLVKILISRNVQKNLEGGPFVCKECNRTYPTLEKFKKHIHTKKPCPICHKEFSSNTLKRHIVKHTDEPQICELCGSSFKNSDCLRSHVFYTHNRNRYECDRCGKLFQKRYARDLHIKSSHDDNPDFVCDTCGKKFYSSRRLDIHIKRTHEKIRAFECDFCHKAFSSKHAQQTHRRQHTLEAPYKCELCSESFRQKVSLRAHKKSKHNIVEEIVCTCKNCGKGFSSEIGLQTHVRMSCY